MTTEPIDRPRDRLLGAMLSVAERRGLSALPTLLAELPWITLIALPDQGAGVALLERGDVGPEELRSRLDRLLAAHAQGVMFLVLVGGSAGDRAILTAADRGAPDPNRLGVYHLDDAGGFQRVAGRRSGLLAEAGPLVRQATPVGPEALQGIAERAQRDQKEAAAFAAALDKRPQHATRLLGAACIIYYVLSQIWGSQGFNETLVAMGANSTTLVREGELWRLLSHAFLHGNLGGVRGSFNPLHLIVNLIALVSLGSFLEGLLGWRRYLMLYGLSALGGGIASALAGVEQSVGASGAIWGLLAAGVGLVWARSTLLPRFVAARIRPRLYGVLALNVAISLLPLFTNVRIDLFAHAGGGLVGFALAGSGLLTRGMPAAGAPDPAAVRIGAAAMVLLLAASIAVALLRGEPWRHPGAI